MQIFPIILIAIVLAADQGVHLSETHFGLTAGESAAMAWGPIAGILAMTWLGVWWCRRKLDRGGSPRFVLLAERITHYARWMMLLNHAAAVLALGWLHAVRSGVGDLLLVDEIITILPPIIGALGTWWIYYPIERRLRESVLIRRLDEGLAIHPIPSRPRYVGVQARMGLLLLLVPILMIVGLAEGLRMGAARLPDQWEWVPYASDGATLLSAAVVFLFAPLIARVLLHVEPMRMSEMRESLLDICRRHRVRVRDLLLWNTSGSMINAAVMGLIGRLRYVLITDALLESMTEDEVKAVMAHEVGHVRRHHLPWLIAALIAALIVATVIVDTPLRLAYWAGLPIFTANGIAQGVFMAGMITQLIIALWIFGWVSRRFERQADTFAVQHLSEMSTEERGASTEERDAGNEDRNGSGRLHGTRHLVLGTDLSYLPPDTSSGRITPGAVRAMTGALGRIAQLNAVDPERHSWRHGSIAWRQRYLDSIIGEPAEALPIDRIVRRLKLASAVILLLAGAAWAALWWWGV